MQHFNYPISIQSSQTTKLSTNTVRFGDGYEQVTSHGINNISTAWSCSMTDKKAVIDAAFAFLVATGGVAPFTITPVPNEPRIKVRLDGDIKRNQVGGDVWSLNFNLKQTF